MNNTAEQLRYLNGIVVEFDFTTAKLKGAIAEEADDMVLYISDLGDMVEHSAKAPLIRNIRGVLRSENPSLVLPQLVAELERDLLNMGGSSSTSALVNETARVALVFTARVLRRLKTGF